MPHRRMIGFITVLISTWSWQCSRVPPEIASGDEIIAKTIIAAGGSERLNGIKHYAFSYGTTTYTMSCPGPMKMTVGEEPIITEVILVDDQGVRRNCFNNITTLQGPDAAVYRVLAALRGGLFTLSGFRGELAYQGSQSFGPVELHKLTTSRNGMEVEFYVDSQTDLLKRLVFKGYDETQEGDFEINHDFGPYQEFEGVLLPSSWFSSRVGGRGSEFEVQDVRLNPELPPDFFTSLDVQVGDVEIQPGELKGSLVEFAFQRGRLQMGTNWTRRCLDGAGFANGDTLLFQLQDQPIEVVLYHDQPPREALGPGAQVMLPNFGNENYVIYLMSPTYQDLAESLEPLMPIRLSKK